MSPGIARTLESNTTALQHLDVLRVLVGSPSTKVLVPAVLTNLLRPLAEHTAVSSGWPGMTRTQGSEREPQGRGGRAASAAE